MPTLLLMRHGHVSNANLTEFGKRSVKNASEKLATEFNILPGRILTSPKPRAVESAEIASKTFSDASGNILIPEQEGQLVGNSARSFLDLLHDVPDDVGTLLCVTHQGTVANCLAELGMNQIYSLLFAKKVSPASAVIVDLGTEAWESVERGNMKNWDLINP